MPLLLQRLVPLKEAIPVVTLEPSFENILINTDRQNQQEDLIIDANLSQTLLKIVRCGRRTDGTEQNAIFNCLTSDPA